MTVKTEDGNDPSPRMDSLPDPGSLCCKSCQKGRIICLISLYLCLSCSVYCTWIITEVKRHESDLHLKCLLLNKNDQNQKLNLYNKHRAEDGHNVAFRTKTSNHDSRDVARELSRHARSSCTINICAKKKKMKKKGCSEYCKSKGLLKERKRGSKTKKPIKVTMPAAHYVSSEDLARAHEKLHLTEFSLESKPITAFEQVGWLNDTVSPFHMDPGGKFIAKSSGIYLVYAQVTFRDIFPMESARLEHRKGNMLRQKLQCYQSVGEVNESVTELYKTCTIIGLLALDQGDSLQLYNVYRNVNIWYTERTTYFGVVGLQTMISN